MDKRKIKKLLILNLPYFLVGLFATNLGEAWRLAEGADSSAKILSFFTVMQQIYPVTEPGGNGQIVEGCQNGFSRCFEQLQGLDLAANVQMIGGFIENHRRRLLGKGTGHLNPLLFTAGQTQIATGCKMG